MNFVFAKCVEMYFYDVSWLCIIIYNYVFWLIEKLFKNMTKKRIPKTTQI